MSSLSDLVLPHIARLHAYTPGQQPTESGWVKLNTNESGYPPSPRVAEAIQRELAEGGARLRLYPNPTSAPVRAAVAAYHGHGLSAANVLVGNGSDDVLNLLVRCFGGVAAATGFTFPSYSLYPVLVGIQDGRSETIPFDRSMRLPVAQIAASTARAFFLTSPNAPTGVAFSPADVEELLAAYPGVLVLDEAYAPFARHDGVPLLARHPRLVIVRTLSKAHALAGLRVGYALAHPEMIGFLDRIRDSYNVNRLSQAGAIAALEDTVYYTELIARVRATRDRCWRAWTEGFGWFAYPSEANFIFVEPRNARGETGVAVARSLDEALRARRILVRSFPNQPLTASFLRISVGTDADMAAVDDVLLAWQKHAH